MAEQSFYTREGLERLKFELHDLKSRGRIDMARQIQEARDKGDLSENAEYDAAKEAQGLMEMKINQLETLVANARLLDESEMDNSRVYILSQVKLKNLQTKKDVTYTLVAAKEANLAEGKISVDSPIGRGLLGKVVGDEVDIAVPAGNIKLKVLSIVR
jgi:transcription elongation factor GreA